MADLTAYHKRRDFARTSEPRGASVKEPAVDAQKASYVIQKHAARHLHYDFRLELNGVLLSWAVPKGPSLDPSVRRLAVEVEPHPVEYGDFEGEIAEGQYGAGAVMVWDNGTWQTLDEDPKAAYDRGHLTFRLNGQKLRGAWHLVRSRGRKDQKQWLLFKSRDEYAEAGENTILERAPNSVVSGRSIEEIARHEPTKRTQAKRAPTISADKPATSRVRTTKGAAKKYAALTLAKLQQARKRPLPTKFDVQLAQLADAAPEGEDWLHEIKYDGYRIVVRVNDERVQLQTRKGLDWTAKMPALASAFSQLSLSDAIIDGEFVALDADGVSHFQTLQNSLSSNEDDSLVFYAFDLLYYAGFDLSDVPLLERKTLLKQILVEKLRGHPESITSRIRFSEHVIGTGPAFFSQAGKLGLEGIVSKRAQGAHVKGRSSDWLKVKCTQRQEFVVVGYTDPAGSRSNFGALVVAVNEGPRLVYAGRVGTGFTAASLAELHAKLVPLQTEKLDLVNAPRGAHARGVHWVKPMLVAQVAFTGFTEDGVLRHPSFEGLRDDKKAAEVRRERASTSKTRTGNVTPTASKTANVTPRLNPNNFKLSNPDKLLYPEQGITKKHLLDYAALVAPYMLPHVVNRPLTLVRCPNGAGKQCFFQKHPGDAEIPGLHAVGIRESEGKADYTVVRDAEGLFALVQLGVLEIHTSGALADDYEHPNVLVFDLDPDPEVQFPAVIDCARRLREIFAGAKLESFVKTTGGKGLHVCIPIDPVLEWSEAKAFTQRVAQAMVKESPNLYVATQSKAQRKGKIYIDYLRNGRGATFVAPYSTRARASASVATPLFWEELTSDLKPDQFTVENLPRRLAELGEDPFARMPELRQRLPSGPTNT